ncbi:mitochondrial carrier superfamily protein [Cardiosporidium cionae]|uniref:Mitochondrial carrier superfamily protein n=1 Tax=Cardiosporidium cionae TaxID=476202 RepID=A0ABQ7JFC9_9APIC|nr:mitochondrial carrier superfamily protein [Cardiosporidium cionae]|eukprot:KAF8822703.1 mitochondrial carrier superfamily protein [Cardiosporidium cionae]
MVAILASPALSAFSLMKHNCQPQPPLLPEVVKLLQSASAKPALTADKNISLPLESNNSLSTTYNPSAKHCLVCGALSGTLCASLFSPWDRALYLSVKNNLPFFHRRNWINPYDGCLQSLAHRALSSGLYFPLETAYFNSLSHENNTSTTLPMPLVRFLSGNLAGISSALLLHPLSVVKYHRWGTQEGRWHSLMLELWESGLKSMYRAIASTMLRDVIFGGVFSYLRHIFCLSAKEYVSGHSLSSASLSSSTANASHSAYSLLPTAFGPFIVSRIKDARLSTPFHLLIPHSPSSRPQKILSKNQRLCFTPFVPYGVLFHFSQISQSICFLPLPRFSNALSPFLLLSSPVFSLASSSPSPASFPSLQPPSPLSFASSSPTCFVPLSSSSLLLPISLFICNSAAATIAVILASPFNFVRNIKFSHWNELPSSRTLSMYTILKQLFQECSAEKTFFRKLLHLQGRLRIGWGSARVAVGMGCVSQIYEWCAGMDRI